MMSFALLLSFLGRPTKASAPIEVAGWSAKLQARLRALDDKSRGRVGVFVRDLADGSEVSLHGEDPWYLASGVKVPVAVELLAQVASGQLSLEETVTLRDSDKMDSAGPTNSYAPGTRLSLRFLLDQMLIYSDNTASDLLIEKVGLENVNRRVQALVPNGFYPLTSLGDVRRLAYSEFHASARALENPAFLALKALPANQSRVNALAAMLGIERGDFRARSLTEAFHAYYSKRWNSATLRAYANFLEEIASGRALPAKETALLLEIMARVQTGKARIQASLSSRFEFAHKTGTQFQRVCDFGILWERKFPERKVIVAACARDFPGEAQAEGALAEVGRSLIASGVFAR